MDMTQNHSLLWHKGNFNGKAQNNRNTQICLKYNLGTSLVSTLMTYVKSISNWPDLGPKIFPFCGTKVIFMENLKTTEAHKYT